MSCSEEYGLFDANDEKFGVKWFSLLLTLGSESGDPWRHQADCHGVIEVWDGLFALAHGRALSATVALLKIA
ncbi:MAG: hypothetical protein VX694_12410 [Planctomycetota bacterium]|nr:hypothetical protein [Planctomycetota bacterium]MEC7680065.1 hypothetical protein [Planctomycetota bacterium]